MPLVRGRLGRSLAVGALAAAMAMPAAPAAAAPDEAAQLLALLNGERADHGLAPLRLQGALDAGAQAHARTMAAEGRLFHTSMVDSAPAGWRNLGENVGRAGDARALHDALMASPTHRANVLDPSYDYVGIGVAAAGADTVASFKFADHPAGDLAAPARGPERSVSPTGVVTASGGATFHGDLTGNHLAAPVVGLEPTPSGRGYWLVASDGGVFAFGDAPFLGSGGGRRLPAPVVGMRATPSGGGYWLATANGKVLAFGDAGRHGSLRRSPRSPIARINRKSDGAGYALYAADGTRYGFGSAR